MKTCPPGVICVENTTIFFMFIIIFILAYFLLYKGNDKKQTKTNSYELPSATNIGSSSFLGMPVDFLGQSAMVRRSPNLATSDTRGDVLLNPYMPPVKNDMYVMPINVRTQGFDSNYRQMGILTSTNNKQTILPLMGRPLITGRDLWQYYTMSEINNIKLPISRGKRSCTNEYGCDKLYDGDTVFVQGYNDVFNVTVYDNDVMRYLPVL